MRQKQSNSQNEFFIDEDGSGMTSHDIGSASEIDQYSSPANARYDGFIAPLVQKFVRDIDVINSLIIDGEELLTGSRPDINPNDIKKNLMWLTSLKMMLEVINHNVRQYGRPTKDPFIYPSLEDMNGLIARYGANSDPTHFDNSTTRAFLIHFPRMLDKFLLIQSHSREYSKLTKFIDNLTKVDKLASFNDGSKQYYPLSLALSIAEQFETKALNNQELLKLIEFPDERNAESLLSGIDQYLLSVSSTFPWCLTEDMISDYKDEINSYLSAEVRLEELTDATYEDFINTSKLRLIGLVINKVLVENLYEYFVTNAQSHALSDLSLLFEEQEFKDICSLGFFSDEQIQGILKLCDIEKNIHFSKQFLVLLTNIKYNNYNPEGVIKAGTTPEYVYDFNSYDYVLADGSTPEQFNSDKVEAGSISSLDEFWVKNNSSNIPQVFAYLFSDVLHSGQNLFFKGEPIVAEDLLRNPGYPFTLKALNLHALSQYNLRSPDLKALEGSLKLQPQTFQAADREAEEKRVEEVAVALDHLYLDVSGYENSLFSEPKNNLIVKSGFELEVGIEDSGEIEDQETLNQFKQAVQTKLFNKIAEEGIAINEDKRAEIIAGLNSVSRTELALLHLIFVNEIGQNIAFMNIPREEMGQKVVEFLQAGILKQKITDVIYAYEVNIHNPTSLHETVSIAKSLEQQLYDFYETNFGVKVVQAPSFQLNISPWVVDKEGQFNLADPSKQYSRKDVMREDGTVEVTDTLSSIQNNAMYTRMIEEVGKELTILIKQDTGVFRCSKVVSQIDWKAYPERQEQFTQSLGSAYATHRINSGKSATIRAYGENIKTSRFEIRLFGPNVHMEAQMPNPQNFDERLFNQSEMLDLIAEAVLKAFDTVNREMVYNPKDLSPNVEGFGSPRKPFNRARSWSQGEKTISEQSVASIPSCLSSASDFEDKDIDEGSPTWLQLVSSADEEVHPDAVCKVM